MKTWIELARDRLIRNAQAIRAAATPSVLMLFVIKANAYGHDAAIIAQALNSGWQWFGVTDVEEGIRVRQAITPVGSTGPVSPFLRAYLVNKPGITRLLVMCGMEPGDAPAIIEHNLTPIVWTLQHLKALEEAMEGFKFAIPVHVEIDTGMSRQGIGPGPELDALLAYIANSQLLTCEGVMTHLACAEFGAGTPGAAFTAVQQERFAAALEQVMAAPGIRPRYIHVGNTSAVDEGSTTRWLIDQATPFRARPMVRTGLALYGDSLPLEGESVPLLHPHLQPVLTWKTRILDLRDIPAGTTVGYGATFTAPTSMRLALLPIGYADGFRREASSGLGNGWVIIDGQKASVVGRVSMNLTVIDVTSLAASIGDEVILLGEGVSAADHACWCNTIPYEILCGIRAPSQLV